MNGPALPLNSAWLRHRIAELGLRQWWLAEQIGVDRRTVMRWVNGQVRSLLPEHAQRLAGVLGCPVAELLRHDEAPELAGADAQRAAGHALAAARLLDRLGPVHEWDVAERLLKAITVPDLPRGVLGELYLQLTEACWRQDKLAEAERHAARAFDIATSLGDPALTARALGHRANLRYWRGEVEPALADWHAALAGAAGLEARVRAGLHSNLGAALYETGRLDAGETQLREALALLRRDGPPMNRSIAHGHLALLALERGDAAGALREARRSEALARRGAYRRGLAFAALLRADALALQGDAAGARAALGLALPAYAALGIREALNHRLAARALRRLGAFDEAGAQLALAARLATGFPVEAEAVRAEQARLDRAVSPPVTGAAAPGPLP